MKISWKWQKENKSNPFSLTIDECFNKNEADKIKRLNFEELLSLSTDDRIRIFLPLIGSKAEWFNSRLENDFILKTQKEGLLNWAKKAEMSEKARNEIIRRISKIEKMITPEEENILLEQFADLKLGISLTEDEENTIWELSRKVDEEKLKMESDGSVELYEAAKHALDAYIEMLKHS